MPRKRARAKGRNYDPTPAEERWLIGEPFPPTEPGLFRTTLGFSDPKPEEDDWRLRGLSRFFPFGIGKETWLNRMRGLYEAAPEPIRLQVPETRRKILTGRADAGTWREDEAREERLQRETVWHDPFSNEWLAMSDEQRHAVLKISGRPWIALEDSGKERRRRLVEEYEQRWGERKWGERVIERTAINQDYPQPTTNHYES